MSVAQGPGTDASQGAPADGESLLESVLFLILTLGFGLGILVLVVICAVGALWVKDLMSAAVIFGAYSFLMCLLWTEMGAVDVAFTEAAVGAGVSTVFFIATAYRTSRKTKD